MMIGTEIVNSAHQKYTPVHGGQLTGLGARATHQRRPARAESGIEPFDVGGVDAPVALRGVNQGLDGGGAPCSTRRTTPTTRCP